MWQHVDIISKRRQVLHLAKKREARVETDRGGMGAHDCRTHDFAARHEQLRCINLHQRAPRLPFFNWEPWDVACQWKQKLITRSCVWCICLNRLAVLITIIWFGPSKYLRTVIRKRGQNSNCPDLTSSLVVYVTKGKIFSPGTNWTPLSLLRPPTHLSINQEHLPEILLHTSHHSEMAARETPFHRSLEEESFLKRLPSPRRSCWCFWPDANLRLNKIQPCQRSACPLHSGQLPLGRDSVVISVCRLWTLNTGLN